MIRRYGPINTDLHQDILQAAYTGLILACKQYDPKRGADIMTYASIRMRGEVIDMLRRYRPFPKAAYRDKTKSKRLGDIPVQVVKEFEYEYHCPTVNNHGEMEESHDTTLKYLSAIQDTRLYNIAVLYYEYDHTCREIGDIYNISESRTSQLLTDACAILRKYYNPDAGLRPPLRIREVLRTSKISKT